MPTALTVSILLALKIYNYTLRSAIDVTTDGFRPEPAVFPILISFDQFQKSV